MEKLDRRRFLLKSCRWCMGVGGLLVAGNLISCTNGDVNTGVETYETPTNNEQGSLRENPASSEQVETELAVRINERCTGCGKCTRGICPEDAIQLVGRQAVITAACKSCGRCISVCPNGAIEYVELARLGSSPVRV